MKLLNQEIDELGEEQTKLCDALRILRTSNKQLVDEIRTVERLISKSLGDKNNLAVLI